MRNELLTMSRTESFRAHNLTNREIEAAELVLQGLSNNEIVKEMLVSLPTVKAYITAILKKYRVSRRTAFMARFFS
jgi:DNA-binding CsgD family transcriptional regulator